MLAAQHEGPFSTTLHFLIDCPSASLKGQSKHREKLHLICTSLQCHFSFFWIQILLTALLICTPVAPLYLSGSCQCTNPVGNLCYAYLMFVLEASYRNVREGMKKQYEEHNPDLNKWSTAWENLSFCSCLQLKDMKQEGALLLPTRCGFLTVKQTCLCRTGH